MRKPQHSDYELQENMKLNRELRDLDEVLYAIWEEMQYTIKTFGMHDSFVREQLCRVKAVYSAEEFALIQQWVREADRDRSNTLVTNQPTAQVLMDRLNQIQEK